ncbi:Fe-S cluster assembly protein SufD [Rhodobacteraceae bacterium 2376]|uniref:Fe-S cluster assembly protein SufD n=1 Tax=Rhabdonatronobacter sediminivivens TaxID=2743469 RepID=A0A7Z0KWC5_9RHOB|nr:Fe-S cluster assembly protein SufD [Rhabdonatronobacter sediminivivens]NYS23674.1 Fe-S cluster assembly protein SufD [Rhabdonatronobacter sediminivivens]
MVFPRQKLLAQKREAAEARLAPLALPAGGKWITTAREDAKARLSAMGLPVRRDEYWKYTDPASLVQAEAPAAALFDDSDESEVFDTLDPLKIVFVDGVFDPEASDDLAMEGVEIALLSEAAKADLHWARDLYGALEADGQSPVERPLAIFNTAFAAEGVLIRATGQAARKISLIYRRRDAGADVLLHHVVKVEAGAEVTVLEHGPAGARFNQVMEVDVADGATLHHVRAQGRDHERRTAAHLFARMGERSVFKSFTLTANGAMVRNEAVIWLNGKGGVAHIAGATVGEGAFHHDDTVFITHAAPDCESRQVFKKVLRHGAVGVFQGKILVKQPAQLTDGYQISQALLLDENAQFLAKPELEIYADDVKCSHGSTSGEIDPVSLFYLRARGIPEDQAKLLLVLAFLAEALDEIEDPDLADDLRPRIETWLRRRSG